MSMSMSMSMSRSMCRRVARRCRRVARRRAAAGGRAELHVRDVGRVPGPTVGNPAFEKCPLVPAGLNDVTTAPGPPFTMMDEIAVVEDQFAPRAVPFVMTTVLWFVPGPA